LEQYGIRVADHWATRLKTPVLFEHLVILITHSFETPVMGIFIVAAGAFSLPDDSFNRRNY
jgi:hypothetical protein